MKNYLFSLYLILSVSLTCNAQLSGFAYLSGQTNHSNITVKFIAVSPAAVTDSALTAADGSYSINITGGVYQVIFSKTNYQNIYYNGANALALTNSVVLATQTMVLGNFYNVSGNVFGTWTSNSIYLVTGNCTVPIGSTLTIQPGAIIKFNGNYSLTVKGGLSAIGSPSNKIIFTSAQISPKARDWYGICPENNTSIVKNCLIEYAFSGIYATAGSHTVENCEIKNSAFGIYLFNDNNGLLKNNLIWDLQDSYFSCGILIEGQSSTMVECNTLHTISGVGIRAWSGVNIKNNLIHHITKPSTDYGWGIWNDYYASGRVENNYIHHCVSAISVGDSPISSSNPINPTIINNVLTNNINGIQYTAEAYGVIVNNILSDNQTGIKNFNWANANSISNNLFWNNSITNFTNVSVAGLGQITGINSAGYAIDSYNNLFQDPVFILGSPFCSANSPCFNSGKTQYSSNIGMNANLICQDMVMGITSEKDNSSLIRVFPNPFKEQIMVTNLSVNKISGIVVYNLSGRRVHRELQYISENEIILETQDLPSGFYFLEINYSHSSNTYLRVIKE